MCALFHSIPLGGGDRKVYVYRYHKHLSYHTPQVSLYTCIVSFSFLSFFANNHFGVTEQVSPPLAIVRNIRWRGTSICQEKVARLQSFEGVFKYRYGTYILLLLLLLLLGLWLLLDDRMDDIPLHVHTKRENIYIKIDISTKARDVGGFFFKKKRWFKF